MPLLSLITAMTLAHAHAPSGHSFQSQRAMAWSIFEDGSDGGDEGGDGGGGGGDGGGGDGGGGDGGGGDGGGTNDSGDNSIPGGEAADPLPEDQGAPPVSIPTAGPAAPSSAIGPKTLAVMKSYLGVAQAMMSGDVPAAQAFSAQTLSQMNDAWFASQTQTERVVLLDVQNSLRTFGESGLLILRGFQFVPGGMLAPKGQSDFWYPMDPTVQSAPWVKKLTGFEDDGWSDVDALLTFAHFDSNDSNDYFGSDSAAMYSDFSDVGGSYYFYYDDSNLFSGIGG